ncbi:MAG: NAD(P)H-dependent oxidoreductase subunit E [Nitrospiraceae bacterium]|nr:NAD(P)H-dependent oxidoreductase subunit E [Nitrospiraceae bacterium]
MSPAPSAEKPLAGLEEIKKNYPASSAALMPALYEARRQFGWLSPEALSAVADALNLPKAAVRSTASFYGMFNQGKTGRHLVRICTNVACMVLGAGSVLEKLEARYGLTPGGTSRDGRFSLAVTECIGACDKGPAMLVDDDMHTDLTGERITEVLERYE